MKLEAFGQRRGSRVAISERFSDGSGRRKLVVRCDCGRDSIVQAGRFLRGKLGTTCLPCAKTQHGHANSPTYLTWRGMKRRCDNPSEPRYPHYGGRGIGYDPRWSDFAAFLEDMGERPAGKTLDRIDVHADYCKDNCRWATLKQQAANRQEHSPEPEDFQDDW